MAVGKAELPKPDGAKAGDDDDFDMLDILILGLPVVLIGGGIWMFMNRKKK
ncbi:MAG: LPXTG cell wall anchor domain-containing protein [Acidaminococcaceae bacterium]|nr:LPXTG cell wall anchor domain-containing protein [Acidaminococcaceae bacterium]